MNARAAQRWNGLAWMVAVVFMWCWCWKHASVEWRMNEDYSFGFAVPFLAGVLAWQRWVDRDCPALDGQMGGGALTSGTTWLITAAMIVLVPTELLRLQDPTWRVSGWLLAAIATSLTAAWMLLLGGWNVLRWFLVPLGFLWLALPWPSAIETPVILSLLGMVTTVSVDLLNWAGIPALQQGNLVVLKQGVVGVDRACSGVQSLQAGLMLAVFAGEWFRLPRRRRVMLVAAGFCLAIMANLWRVIALTMLVHAGGVDGMEQQHDRIGMWATVILCGLLLGLGWLMRHPANTRPEPPLRGAGWWAVRGVSGWLLLALVLGILLGAQAWMHRLSAANDEMSHQLWQLSDSGLPEGWSAVEGEFSGPEISQLRFTKGKIINLTTSEGTRFQVVHLFWTPELTVPEGVYSHRPEICMPSAGWMKEGEPQPLMLRHVEGGISGGIHYFQKQFARRTVFHAVWYGGRSRPVQGQLEAGEDRLGRLALLWKSPGRRSHEVVTVFMDGADDLGVLKGRLEQALGVVLRSSSPEKATHGSVP